MAETERERLERYISVIKEWRATRPPQAIYSIFELLEDCDQTKNEDLWDELERALKENKDFKWKPFQQFMRPFRERAKEGYWWWAAI